ncbi:MAG: hypothetical protein J6Y72_04180 [Bacteroidales bacterium]|nr:hypothetical protein [Bacteroidales bacterium]
MKKTFTMHFTKLGVVLVSVVVGLPVTLVAQTNTFFATYSAVEKQAQKVVTSSITYDANDAAHTRYDYELDDNGNVVKETYQVMEDGEWRVHEVVEKTYDSEGRELSCKRTELYSESGEMYVAENYVVIYDEKGNSKKRYIERRNNWGTLVEELFDEQGNLEKITSKRYDKETGWSIDWVSMNENEYDENNHLIGIRSVDVVDGEEKYYNYVTYTYDANGNKTSEVKYTPNSETGDTVVNSRTDYTYDANGKQTVYIYSERDSKTGELVVNNRADYTYDANGNETVYIYSVRDSETGELMVKYRDEYTYDANGNQTSKVDYYRDSETGKFVVENRYDYTYDANGKVTEFVHSWDDSETGELVVGYRYEYTYDANGNETSSVLYKRDSETGKFVVEVRYEYTYDANGNKTSYTQSWSDSETGEFAVRYREEYTYDDVNNTSLVKIYKTRELLLDEYTEYTYAIVYVDVVVEALPIAQANDASQRDNRIFDMSGRYVGTSTNGLPSGLYVRNGRIFLVK